MIRLFNLVLLSACCTLPSTSFKPTPREFVQPNKRNHFPWMKTPEKVDVVAESNGISHHDTTSVQNVAIEALETLKARQQSELEETERLLELMKQPLGGGSGSNSRPSPSSLSTAASILSGVDYGFISRSEGSPSTLHSGWENAAGTAKYGGPPGNLWTVGSKQFVRNFKAILGEYTDEPDIELTSKQVELQEKLQKLTLNSTEIWEREFADGPILAPYVIKIPYLMVCYLLDVVFEKQYVPSRFVLLETVARMPYFSYITMLHLYETLGFWRRSADVKRIHFAEELNEYRHLLIMESLGGDQSWWVRFLAQHSAIAYYIILCVLFAISPSLSYRFSELLETHAVNTYGVFLDENEDLLKELPPSTAAVDYYSLGTSDPFYAEFQTAALSTGKELRRPGVEMQSLYDVFSAIRDDEGDHVSTMAACLDPDATLRSPSLERRILTGVALVATASVFLGTTELSGFLDYMGIVDTAEDAAIGGATDATILEAMIAGGAGLVQTLIEDEKARDITEIGTDLVEGGAAMGALEQIRRAGIEIIEFIERVL